MEASQWALEALEGCAYLCIFVPCCALKALRALLSFLVSSPFCDQLLERPKV